MGLDCNNQDTAVFSSASYGQEPLFSSASYAPEPWEVDLGLQPLAQVQLHLQPPVGYGMHARIRQVRPEVTSTIII